MRTVPRSSSTEAGGVKRVAWKEAHLTPRQMQDHRQNQPLRSLALGVPGTQIAIYIYSIYKQHFILSSPPSPQSLLKQLLVELEGTSCRCQYKHWGWYHQPCQLPGQDIWWHKGWGNPGCTQLTWGRAGLLGLVLEEKQDQKKQRRVESDKQEEEGERRS